VHVRLNESGVGHVTTQIQDLSVRATPAFDILRGPDRHNPAVGDRDGIGLGAARIHGDDCTEDNQICFL
jgi:hypothetical protein